MSKRPGEPERNTRTDRSDLVLVHVWCTCGAWLGIVLGAGLRAGVTRANGVQFMPTRGFHGWSKYCQLWSYQVTGKILIMLLICMEGPHATGPHQAPVYKAFTDFITTCNSLFGVVSDHSNSSAEVDKTRQDKTGRDKPSRAADKQQTSSRQAANRHHASSKQAPRKRQTSSTLMHTSSTQAAHCTLHVLKRV